MIGKESDIGASLSDIWQAWHKFRKGKKKNFELDRFSYFLESNLSKLYHDLLSHTYQHGDYRTFYLTDTKKRVISVASIRDRVVHRLIYDFLVSIFDKRFIFDVWSCRKNKGLLGAIERTQQLLANNRYAYVWRSEITKFFDSVDHDILKACIKRRVFNKNNIALIENVVDSFSSSSPGRGMPIGNLTSQIFCNIYLHELDHYVNHTIRPKGYLRYGDDFIIIVPEKKELERVRKTVTEFIEQELKLTVNKRNNVVISVRNGVHFLGCDIFPTGRRLRQKMYARIENRLKLVNCSSYRSLIIKHCIPEKQDLPSRDKKKPVSHFVPNKQSLLLRSKKNLAFRKTQSKVKWIDWKIVDIITQIL